MFLTVIISCNLVISLDLNELFSTILLIMPFIMIIDFIVSKINKNFKVNKIAFYIRMDSLIIWILILKSDSYFSTLSY